MVCILCPAVGGLGGAVAGSCAKKIGFPAPTTSLGHMGLLTN
jgi:hypothetical protein